MAIKVAKFGGSSMASAEQFRKVKAIIESDPARQYVVPSAPGKRFSGDDKVTDLLYKCYRQYHAGEDYSETFQKIRERYTSIESELNLKTNITEELNAIAENLENSASEDYMASRGEYLNAILLADYLGFTFVDASELICFHSDGTYDDETTAKWARKLRTRSKVVVPGFYGRKRDGSIKTFSRGGSDISGSIVAKAVKADIYENWTDVSGFMMADPRIVDDPRIISTVSYSELRELAYMGASVLHEDSVFPVRKAHIPINVRNTNEPDAPGTMVVPDDRLKDYNRSCVLTGIAGRSGFTVITVTKDNMHNEIGFGYRLLRVLNKYSVSFEHVPSGIDSMSIVIADQHLRDNLDAIIADINQDCAPKSVEIQSNMALIATVGMGMVRSIGTAAKLFTALCNAGVNVRMIDQGSSEMNIIVGVESDQLHTAVRAIYGAFA